VLKSLGSELLFFLCLPPYLLAIEGIKAGAFGIEIGGNAAGQHL
jgi:hypothetical protein